MATRVWTWATFDTTRCVSRCNFRRLRAPVRSRSGWRAPGTPCPSARDRLDAGDHLVHRLVDRHLLVHHAIHRLRPYVLVVQNRELVVPGEFERHRAGMELLPD